VKSSHGISSGALGGLALVGSTFLAWTASGAGSNISAHRLGDLLLSDAAKPWVPRWFGLVVYLVPVGGVLVIVASGLDLAAAPLVKSVGLGVAALVTAATVVAMPMRHALDLGPGALLAVAGLALGFLSVLADRRSAATHSPEEGPCPSA
jgi:hypothetical protein